MTASQDIWSLQAVDNQCTSCGGTTDNHNRISCRGQYSLLGQTEKRITFLDHFVTTCCGHLNDSVNEKLKQGQCYVFADERFLQYQLYEIFARNLSREYLSNIHLEYPLETLQIFKESKKGGPRRCDFAFLTSPSNYPLLVLELKLASNPRVEFDLIRLTHLKFLDAMRGRAKFQGSKVCMFLYAGKTEQVKNLSLTGCFSDSICQTYLRSDPQFDEELVVTQYESVCLLDTTKLEMPFSLRLWKVFYSGREILSK